MSKSAEEHCDTETLRDWWLKWQKKFIVDKCKEIFTGNNSTMKYKMRGSAQSTILQKRHQSGMIHSSMKTSICCSTAIQNINQFWFIGEGNAEHNRKYQDHTVLALSLFPYLNTVQYCSTYLNQDRNETQETHREQMTVRYEMTSLQEPKNAVSIKKKKKKSGMSTSPSSLGMMEQIILKLL